MIIHCHSKEKAQSLLAAIRERLGKFGLELSEEKTKLFTVSGETDQTRKKKYKSSLFWGHDFKPKTARNSRTGKKFLGFLATASSAARTKMSQTFKGYNIQRRTDLSLEEIGEMINAKVRGWINYFEPFGRNDLWHLFDVLNYRLLKWWKRKYKLESIYAAIEQIRKRQQSNPKLFAHWHAGYMI